jgi:uncharacterized membrane protein
MTNLTLIAAAAGGGAAWLHVPSGAWWVMLLITVVGLGVLAGLVAWNTEFFKNLDRRWIFLMMFLATAVPIYVIGKTGETFPEKPVRLAQNVFNEIEKLERATGSCSRSTTTPAAKASSAPWPPPSPITAPRRAQDVLHGPLAPRPADDQGQHRGSSKPTTPTWSTARTTSTSASRRATRASSRSIITDFRSSCTPPMRRAPRGTPSRCAATSTACRTWT